MQQAPSIAVGNSAPPLSTQVRSYGDQDDFWDRWVYITAASWPSIGAYDTQVLNFDPITALLNTPSISRKWANFNRLVWDSVEVRIVMMTSQSQYGHIIFGAVPMGTEVYNGTDNTYGCSVMATSTTADTLPNVNQITHGLHGHMSPQTSAPLVFQLPWISPRDGLAVQDIGNTGAFGGGHQSQWRVLGIIVEPLSNATNMASIANGTFTVYARFRGMRLQAPIQFQAKKQGTVGKAAASVKSIASALKPLPIVGEFAEGVELVSSAVGAVADYFGFTRETNRADVDRAVLFAAADLPFADGIDSAPTLSLLRDNKVSIDPRIGGLDGVDCEAFSDVLPREGLLTNTMWTASHTVGTVLMGFGVCPTNYVRANVGGLMYPTPAGWIGEHFENWRGTMHYTVRVHASAFHRGLLQVVWNPSTSTPFVAASDPTNVTFNRVIEVRGDTVFHFTVGWQTPALFLKSAGRARSGINFNVQAPGFDNGFLQIRVAGELTAPDPTATLLVEVYQSADPDMVFANPCSLPNDFQFQSSEDSEEMSDVELVPGSPGDPTAVAMGETIMSVRTLLQRPYYISNLDSTVPIISNARPIPAQFSWVVVPFVGPRNVLGVGINQNYQFGGLDIYPSGDPVATLAPMYLGWRGSLRFKVAFYRSSIYNDGTTAGTWELNAAHAIHAAYTTPNRMYQNDASSAGTGSYGDTSGGTGSGAYEFGGITFSGQWDGLNLLEFNVPHYYPRRYTLCRNIPLTGVFDPGFCITAQGILSGAVATASTCRMGRVFRSVGDDFSLVQFRYVPAIKRQA